MGFLPAAFRTDTLDDIFCRLRYETFWITDGWNVCLSETIGLLALHAIEMAMQFINMAAMVIVAEAIFLGAASIFNLMDKMMFAESPDDAEQSRLVHRVQLVLQIGKAESVLETLHRLVNIEPHGSQTDFMTSQYLFCFTHRTVQFKIQQRYQSFRDYPHPLPLFTLQPGCIKNAVLLHQQ